MTDLVRYLTNFFVGLGRGLLESNREFKATLAHCTTLKSVEKSVKTASLNVVIVS